MRNSVYVTVRCLSVSLSHRSTTATVAGRFAAKCPAGRRYQSIAAGLLQALFCRRRHSAANTGSIMLRADGGSTKTCFNMQLEGFQSIWGGGDSPISSPKLCCFGRTYALCVIDKQLPIQVDLLCRGRHGYLLHTPSSTQRETPN